VESSTLEYLPYGNQPTKFQTAQALEKEWRKESYVRQGAFVCGQFRSGMDMATTQNARDGAGISMI
jgi:hypothetical protein